MHSGSINTEPGAVATGFKVVIEDRITGEFELREYPLGYPMINAVA